MTESSHGYKSSECTVDDRSVQGGILSADWYNLMSATQMLWNTFSLTCQLADDDSECVSGALVEE